MFTTFARLLVQLLVPEFVKLLEAELAALEAKLTATPETNTDGQ